VVDGTVVEGTVVEGGGVAVQGGVRCVGRRRRMENLASRRLCHILLTKLLLGSTRHTTSVRHTISCFFFFFIATHIGYHHFKILYLTP
jgi:hypothetical protein